jgi:heme oxygenase (biliverdin-IX-beta and delta-forming)
LALEAPAITRETIVSRGKARLKLRDATAPDHAAVDSAYAAFDLSRPPAYRAFLEAQYACVLPLESALTDAGAGRLFDSWPSSRRAGLIAADLAEMGAQRRCAPEPAFMPILREPADVLGTLYVLEGSRFGGAVLARRLHPGMPARFLSNASDTNLWRSLVTLMDRHLSSESAFAAALIAARAVFAAFERAARARLELAVD